MQSWAINKTRIIFVVTAIFMITLVAFKTVENGDLTAKNQSIDTQDTLKLGERHISSQEGKNQTKSPNENPKNMGEVQQTLRELSEQISTLRKLQKRNSADNLQVNNENKASDLTQEEEEDQAWQAFEATVDLIEDSVQAEPTDSDWSNLAVTSLYESVQKSTDNTLAIIDVDCRSTLCRMQLALDSESPEGSIEALEETLPWDGEMVFMVDESDIDNPEAIVYIARQEYSLPRLTD